MCACMCVWYACVWCVCDVCVWCGVCVWCMCVVSILTAVTMNPQKTIQCMWWFTETKTATEASSGRNVSTVNQDLVRAFNIFIRHTWTPCTSDQTLLVTFLTIKPTTCTNFSNLFLEWNSTCFGQFLWTSSEVFWLYTQQTCMTYSIAVCTVKNSWWWTEELSETCRVSFKKKFE